jgi:hypothetical protein
MLEVTKSALSGGRLPWFHSLANPYTAPRKRMKDSPHCDCAFVTRPAPVIDMRPRMWFNAVVAIADIMSHRECASACPLGGRRAR